MPKPRPTRFVALLGGLAVAGLLLAGCGAAGLGLGLGALVAGLGALVAWIALSSSATGCGPSRPNVCLSIWVPPPADADPGDAADPNAPPDPEAGDAAPGDARPTVYEFDANATLCLSFDPCLQELPPQPPPDPCLSVAPPGPCLQPPFYPCLEAPVHICLSDDIIEGTLEPVSRTPAARDASADRLAAAGILSDRQRLRLQRLRRGAA